MTDDEYAAFHFASERIDFQLHYGRDPKERVRHTCIIEGSMIEDSYNPGEFVSGDWCCPVPNKSMTDPQDWLRHFFTAAISEAVHEALEWFKVDGRALLDPHNPAVEDVIHAHVAECAHGLFELVGQ